MFPRSQRGPPNLEITPELTTVRFVRIVHAVVGPVTAELLGDAYRVLAGPVSL